MIVSFFVKTLPNSFANPQHIVGTPPMTTESVREHVDLNGRTAHSLLHSRQAANCFPKQSDTVKMTVWRLRLQIMETLCSDFQQLN